MLVILAFGAAAAGAVFVAPAIEGSAFPDPPDEFVRFEDRDVSFRHPPGWRAVRRENVVMLRPPTGSPAGAVVVLERVALADARVHRRIQERTDQLIRGYSAGQTAYEFDVDGHDDVHVADWVSKRGGSGRLERVEHLLLPYGRAGLLSFVVRGPASDDPKTDPRAIMGSFELDA